MSFGRRTHDTHPSFSCMQRTILQSTILQSPILQSTIAAAAAYEEPAQAGGAPRVFPLLSSTTLSEGLQHALLHQHASGACCRAGWRSRQRPSRLCRLLGLLYQSQKQPASKHPCRGKQGLHASGAACRAGWRSRQLGLLHQNQKQPASQHHCRGKTYQRVQGRSRRTRRRLPGSFKCHPRRGVPSLFLLPRRVSHQPVEDAVEERALHHATSAPSAWTIHAAWTSAFGHVATDTFVGIALTRWCINRARFAVAL